MQNNSGSGSGNDPRTRKDAVSAGRKKSRLYRERLLDYIGRLDLTPKMKSVLDALMGEKSYKGPLLASDVFALDECRKQFIFHIHSLQKSSDYRWFFITLFSDDYRVSKKRPVIWLKRLQRKADKTLRKLDIVGAVAKIEAVMVLNPPDTQKPEYDFHVHALCWASQDFDESAAAATLAQSTAWSHCWGMPATHIREITPEMGDAAWWAGYMMKPPVDAKNVVERTNGSVAVRNTVEGYRGDARLRLFEGLSHCRLADMIFAVKDGKFVRDPVMRRTKEARKAATAHLKPVDITGRERLFRRIWEGSKAHHKHSWHVIF